ncbi:MAG: hypothetical protein ABI851_13830 [Saprospiraceae bacterium]
MKSIVRYLSVIILFLSGCREIENLPRLRITNLRLIEFLEPTKLMQWDTTNGPDIFIELSINKVRLFKSETLKDQDIFSTPLNFSLDSTITFQSGKDEILLSVFDQDLNSDQLLQESVNIQPGIIVNSPHSEYFTCNGCFTCTECFAKWEITFKIVN